EPFLVDGRRLERRLAQPRCERLRRLAPKLEPIRRAAQAVERRGRLFAPAGSVGQLLLGTVALEEQLVELRVGALAGERDRGSPLLDLLRLAGELLEVELGDPRLHRGD